MADLPLWCSTGPLSYVLPGCGAASEVDWRCRWLGLGGRIYCKRKGLIKGDDPLTEFGDNALSAGESLLNVAKHIDYIIYGGLVIGGVIVLSVFIQDLKSL